MKEALTEFLNIDDLILLENNPRSISIDQFKKLCNSLETDPSFLDARPVLVNKVGEKNYVYGGNQRVRAAQALGWTEILCHVEYNLSDEIVRQRVIKDNKTFGEFDFDMLANDWAYGELVDAGFQDFEMTGLGNFPEPEEKPVKAKKTKNITCPKCGFKV